MARDLVWSGRASRELFEAMDFLDGRDEELGEELLREVVTSVTPALTQPELFTELIPGVRRALTGRFSYAIFYTFDHDTVVLLALVHTARSPAIWPRGDETE